MPIAAQLLLLAAAVLGVAPGRRAAFWQNEWVLLCPVLVYTLYFNFFLRAQIGIRFYLVVFPLLYVFTGSLVRAGRRLSRAATVALGLAVAYLVGSVLSYYPHFLPYFNELLRDRRQAYTILADSNLDWGQYAWDVVRYWDQHPHAIGWPDQPTAGTIFVNVNRLTGVVRSPEQFRWLRDHFTPTEHIAHGVLVYQVSAADLARILQRPPGVPAAR